MSRIVCGSAGGTGLELRHEAEPWNRTEKRDPGQYTVLVLGWERGCLTMERMPPHYSVVRLT